MRKLRKQFTVDIRCGHCGNSAPMEVVATYSQVTEAGDERSQLTWDEGHVYQLLTCPACEGVILRRYYHHDASEPEEMRPRILYPTSQDVPVGLPDRIK